MASKHQTWGIVVRHCVIVYQGFNRDKLVPAPSRAPPGAPPSLLRSQISFCLDSIQDSKIREYTFLQQSENWSVGDVFSHRIQQH